MKHLGKKIDDREVCIQVRGRVTKPRHRDDLEALIRMLEFASQEAASYGYVDCEAHLYRALDDLNQRLK